MPRPDDGTSTKLLLERLAAARREVKALERQLAASGAVLAPEAGGHIAGVLGVASEQTEREQLEELLTIVTETVPIPVVISRLQDGVVLYANRAFAEFFKTPLDQVIGARAVDHYADPAQRDLLIARMRQEGQVHNMEVQLRCGDGSTRTASCSAVRLLLHGTPALMGAAADISELKEREAQLQELSAQKDLLLREVNHRVRNNLATLMAIIRQLGAAADGTAQAALTRVERNVQGLSVVHDMLSKAGWRPIRLSTLCRDLIVAALTDVAPAPEVHVSEAALRTGSQAAHQLALVVAELATNSKKHALSHACAVGGLRVGLTIEARAGGILIRYHDNGPGFPAGVLERGERGAGLRLVEGLVAYGLAGEVTLANCDGAVIALGLPGLDALDDPAHGDRL